MKTLTIRELLESKRTALSLALVNEGADLERLIHDPSVSNPGLVLAGFTQRFPTGRLQVLGETEISFLRSLDEGARLRTVEAFLGLEVPALVVTKGQDIPAELRDVASARGIPIIVSQLKTGDFFRRIQSYLEIQFAASTTVHGSLADVYGVGLLFVGRSGIGKSECVLDLVERGHRLVADDLVYVTRTGPDVLMGRGHEMQRHHMEIRGIGIVDIQALFGIRSIRQQKRIEVVVQLVDWNEGMSYERTGLDTDETDLLDVKIPKVSVPLNPGKNITVISEVVAMNHLLKYSGINSAELFNRRLQEAMRPVRDYLEEDYE